MPLGSIGIQNGNDRWEENRKERTDQGRVDGSTDSGESSERLFTTLPRRFKSLRGTIIIIDNEKPVDLVEYLGNFLEINDYATNMASFWFLDTLALQLLHHHMNLDGHYLSVLTSWLIGEISLIRDKELSREEFLRETKDMFRIAANEIQNQNRLLYWDEIMHDEEEEVAETVQGIEPGSDSIDPLSALNIIIESTYDMYANELRYALIYAVFVEGVEVQTYDLPFSLRTPRPVKLDGKATFNYQLHNNMTKMKANEKGKKKGKGNLKVPPTPPPSLCQEKVLMEKRRYILPLIEATEALQVFETQ